MVSKALVFLLVAGLVACDSPPDSAEVSSGIEPFSRADTTDKSASQKWLFDGLLKGLNSSEHYVVEGRFLDGDASLTLHSHFNGFEWRDGIQVALVRKGEHLHLEFKVPGFEPREEELTKDFLAKDGRFKMRVEIQNGGTSGLRILVWKYTFSPQGNIEIARPYISEANADFDTRKKAWVYTDNGRGVRWGIEFENAQTLQVFREAPYVP